jgi:hypothetical protein
MDEIEQGIIEQALPADNTADHITSQGEPAEEAQFCCVVCGGHRTSDVFFVICPACRVRIMACVWNSTTEST